MPCLGQWVKQDEIRLPLRLLPRAPEPNRDGTIAPSLDAGLLIGEETSAGDHGSRRGTDFPQKVKRNLVIFRGAAGYSADTMRPPKRRRG